MNTAHLTAFAQPSEVYAVLGRPATTYKRDVERGLAFPLVALGTRRRGLPRAELELLVRARQANLADDDVRTLVAEALAHRERLAAVIRGEASDAV